ncbi:putative DNA recombination [Lyophyllum shimeji]|uniref:DNA recombination n=1 Tax=Lyophyllum shimeji TaxID=47721 RepID=A0A9P3UI13_LYOSH|nr:putative DNA recombination [Lyophyllum shimeji]
MPVQTYSRHSNSLNTPATSSAATPARIKHVHSTSPPPTNSTYSPTVVSGGQQHKLNVVTRVAIEGKAKQDKDGASIRMYVKISLPLDIVQPGITIPLFPEENVKILTSQVHPLDKHSVPYNFSSTLSPLLHNAGRALNLPARSSETFQSAFSLPSPTPTASVLTSRSSKSTNGSSHLGNENIPPVDSQYTGHILISGYHIAYVTPKVFPSRPLSETESEGVSRSSYKHRRPSIGDRGAAQFMAAIDMWIPYVSRPPRYPYLLSIPVPRCLHNNIKLRIFPLAAASASFASLSSIEDEGTSWDLTSDPHVTRTTSARPSRSNSYTHFADDESSDSSTAGFSDGCGIQGTFPSAERIRVRWARPSKNINVPGGTNDGRRRVGVKEVKGEMTCIIRGKAKAKERDGVDGLLMDVEYKGTCKGVWFPGVATLLGMDVGLETKNSDVYWVEGGASGWDVNGGVGYTGFDIGASPGPSDLRSRTESLDSNTPQINISPLPQDVLAAQAAKSSSSSSSTSLLRAPLPGQNVAEYSFEGSAATVSSSASSPLGTMSSISSLMPTSTTDSASPPVRPPGVPVTLHVNMNDIIAPGKNVFTFTITGTILVVARSTISRLNSYTASPTSSGTETEDTDPEPIVLPRFTVLAADSETTSTLVRNEIDGAPATIEVYNSTGDIGRDAQARKTVLQKGGFTRCTEDGARIALRSICMTNGHINGSKRQPHPPSRPRTPTGNSGALRRVPSNPSLGRTLFQAPPKRDGPLMIPSVVASATPLLHEGDPLPTAYAVRVCLNAPSDTDSEWLEFGLAQPGSTNAMSLRDGKDGKPPRVVIISATVNRVPVKHDTVATTKPEASGVGVAFEEMSGKEWISWVRVHVGAVNGGAVVVDYVVSERKESHGKGKAKARSELPLNILLPSFSIPVGRLEVNIEGAGIDITSLKSNFVHQHSTTTGSKLLNYSMEQFFYPQVSLVVRPKPRTQNLRTTGLLTLTLWFSVAACLIAMCHLNSELRKMERMMETYSTAVAAGWNDAPEPVTVTTTVYTSTGSKWWFVEDPTPSSESPTATLPIPVTVAIPEPTDAQSVLALSPSETYSDRDTGHTSYPPESTSFAEKYALLPIQHITFSWPTHDFHSTMEKVMQTIEKVWQIFRKVYHYPLDPP